jgi:small conductance mechanosensitive channel
MVIIERILRGEFINPSTFLGALFYALVFLMVTLLAIRSLRLALVPLQRRLIDRTPATFLSQLGQIFIYIMAFILYALYAHVIPELRSLGTALLAGVSVASILLGLAAQNTLGNLIAGLSLLLYRPFQVGDSVQLTAPTGIEIGKVVDLTLGYTVIRTPEDRQIVVPNSVMANQAIIKPGS